MSYVRALGGTTVRPTYGADAPDGRTRSTQSRAAFADGPAQTAATSSTASESAGTASAAADAYAQYAQAAQQFPKTTTVTRNHWLMFGVTAAAVLYWRHQRGR